MLSFDGNERKERTERNKKRNNDFIVSNEKGFSDESLMSLSLSPKITLTSGAQQLDASEKTLRFSRVSTNSREKLLLVPHGDEGGVLNQNKKPFDDVNFCFVCEKEGLASPNEKKRKNTVSSDTAPLAANDSSWNTTRTSSPTKRRPRSTSAIGNIGRDILHISTEKTGSRMRDGLFMPVYRQVFLCSLCYEVTREAKRLDMDAVTKITDRARSYFL